MHNRIDYTFVLDFEGKLFAAFARQCLFRRFAWLYLAAHEFPHSALGLIRWPLSDKIPVAIFYDGTYDFNYSSHCHIYGQAILLPSSTNHFLFFIF